MKKKHYLVYKTTCLLNGKIYIGQHQTYDINDDYLGSGRLLTEDIKKFGRKNFKREILFDFDNFEDMDAKEKELVTEKFIARDDTYNIRLGGQNPEVDRICAMGREKERQLWDKDIKWRMMFSKLRSEQLKRIWKNRPEVFHKFKNPQAFLGRHHTEESKQKIREKAKLRIGKLNNSFGTIWIYNESLQQNKKVKKELVDTFLNDGWKIGRKMIFNQ